MFALLKMKLSDLPCRAHQKLDEDRLWAPMPTLGEELRRRREERGKTLSGISESTHIVTRFLKAIEEDNFSVLPGGIFTRSFIRAYAREVGMNETDAVTLYYQQTSPQEAPQPTSAPEPAPTSEAIVEKQDGSSLESIGSSLATPSPGFASRTNWPAVATVLAIMVLGGVIVLFVTRMNREETSDSPARPAASKQQARPAPRSAPTPSVSQASGTIPADSPIMAAASIQVISVKVEATGGQCWVKYQVDDGQHTSMMLEEGQSHALPDAQNKVTLDIGNRKALTIKINNHEVTFPPNTPNFSAHVIISRDNLQNYLQTAATHNF